MGVIELSHVSCSRPGGAALLADVSFRVGEGDHVALIGANGVGKTTLLRLISDAAGPPRSELVTSGTVRVDGEIGFMPQLVGTRSDGLSVRQFLLSLAPAHLQTAARAIADASSACEHDPDDKSGLRLGEAYGAWGELGGYELEVLWDTCLTEAVGLSMDQAAERPLGTLSGGEQKRLALEVLLGSHDDILLLDEPDNFLDVAGKRWLESRMAESKKSVLYVSHDRELLANTAQRIVTIEGRGAWTHGGSFGTYQEERDNRQRRLGDEHRRWKQERDRLYKFMRIMKQRAATNDANASRARAAETRYRRFQAEGPPTELAKEQNVRMRLGGGRTGKRVLRCEELSLSGLTRAFSTEVLFGDRVGVLGANGSGKSNFLKLLAGEAVPHSGTFALGARVEPGYFSQSHDHPEWRGARTIELLGRHDLSLGPAMAHLKRYELHGCADQPFETLSGGQQARLQILLLEEVGSTLLLLDEPTDNLDLESAEALEDALGAYEGTVLAVTHDRWFMRQFDRFLVFDAGGAVNESPEPP